MSAPPYVAPFSYGMRLRPAAPPVPPRSRKYGCDSHADGPRLAEQTRPPVRSSRPRRSEALFILQVLKICRANSRRSKESKPTPCDAVSLRTRSETQAPSGAGIEESPLAPLSAPAATLLSPGNDLGPPTTIESSSMRPGKHAEGRLHRAGGRSASTRTAQSIFAPSSRMTEFAPE